MYRYVRSLLIPVFAIAMGACAGPKEIFLKPELKVPLDVGKEAVLVLPIGTKLDGSTLEKLRYSTVFWASLNGEIVSRLNKGAILIPVPPGIQEALDQIGMGDLLAQIPNQMVDAAIKKTPVSDEVTGNVIKIVNFLREKFKGKMSDKMHYIVAAYVEQAPGSLPQMNNLQVKGAIFDLDQKEPLTAIDYTKKNVKLGTGFTEAVMTTTGVELADYLVCPNEAKECAKKKKASKEEPVASQPKDKD